MDNHAVHTKITLRSTTGGVYNYYPTKSRGTIYMSKSSDKQSTYNSLSTFNSQSPYTGDTKHSETDTYFQTEMKKEAIRVLSTEKHHNKKIKELQKRHILPAKTIFLKWWLDTAGYSKPLRTAWEDEEESMFRSTTSSHVYSPTYFEGHGVSFQQSANSGGYMFVSKRDPRLLNSGSGVSGPINAFLKTHKKQKTKTKSLRSYLNSSVSANEFVNQNILRQQFLGKDDELYEKKWTASGQKQRNKRKVNDVHSLLSTMPTATRCMHDQNTSSNVAVPVCVSSPKTSSASHLDNAGVVNKGQEESPMKNVLLSTEQEASNQQTSTPNIIKTDELQCQQNSENNSHLLVNIPTDSHSDSKLFSSNVSGGGIIESISFQANEHKTVELSTDVSQTSIQTYLIPGNCQFTCKAAVSNIRPQESKYEEPHYNLSLNRETEGAIVTTNCDQNYNSPVLRSEPNRYNAGHGSLSLTKEACKGPPTSSYSMDEMKACSLPDNICKPKLLSPNFYVNFAKPTSTELEKHRQLLSSQKDRMENGSVLVDDGNICTKHTGSYFSRLVEKRIRPKESQMSSHEDASKSDNLFLNKHVNTEDQSATMATIFPSSNQSNEQSQLPVAFFSETLWKSGLLDNHHMLHKKALSNDPGNEQIQTPLDDSNSLPQHLPQYSNILPFDKDNCSSNDNASHTNTAMGKRNQVKCFSHVLSECPKSNDCKMSSCDDPPMKSTTNEMLRNHNYEQLESEDGNSSSDDNEQNSLSSDDNEQNSLSSDAHSSVESVSVDSRNSLSGMDKSMSDYLKWSAASWSNTSLPPQHYFESKASNIKKAVSTTNIEEIRQKQIIETANLLILMLDKLPMKDDVWNDNGLHKNKRRCLESTFKCGQGCQWRPVARATSFHSHILSLLKKHYSFNKIKPLKMDNKESAPQETTATYTTTHDSKLGICMHANLIPKQKSENANKKLDTTKTHITLSFTQSLQKPNFQDAPCGFEKHVSKIGKQGCFKHKDKQKQNMGLLHHMFPKRKPADGSQKVSYEISQLNPFGNMQLQSIDSKSQQASQKALGFLQSDVNKISDKRQEKYERNKLQTHINNSENITESGIKNDTIGGSKRMNNEQSSGSSDANVLNARPGHSQGNMAAGMIFNSEAGMLMCHNPHPPDASPDKPQVSITLLSPPCLNTKVPVYPKPKPHALGVIQDNEASASTKACDAANSSVTQLPLASLKRSYSSKFPWAKPDLQKQLQASETHATNASVSLRSATVERNEKRLLQKHNKEARNSQTRKNVLPPLYCNNSVNMNTNLDKLSMNNSKLPKSQMLLDQHKTATPERDSCHSKQGFSSLVHLDSIAKPHCDFCDCKPASPENSRNTYRMMTLTSLQNHEQLLLPLRQRFDRIKSQVSNRVLKGLHCQNLRISCAPHYLSASEATDTNDGDKSIIDSPEMSVSNADANDLQSLLTQNESDEVNSCNNFEMHNLNLFLSKKSIKCEKKETPVVQNTHEDDCPCTSFSPDMRICDESEVINHQHHDNKTSGIVQENNSSEVAGRKLNALVSRSKCPCTSTFKFLTLLLSDELENSQV